MNKIEDLISEQLTLLRYHNDLGSQKQDLPLKMGNEA